MLKQNNYFKKVLCMVVVISMIFSSVSFANFFENSMKMVFAPELEIDDNYVEDGMFYMLHEALK